MSDSDWRTPSVKFLAEGKWKVIDIYTYHSPTHGKSFTVPFGLVIDGVSSPRILWSIIPATGKLFPGAVIHDAMYTIQHWDDRSKMFREEADECLCDMARELGFDDASCEAIHAAVILGGANHWG